MAHLHPLAHQIDRKNCAGEPRDYARAAKVLGLTRARVSQISGLTLLGPSIQEAILDFPDTRNDPVTERQLREIVAEPLWKEQVAVWLRVYRYCQR